MSSTHPSRSSATPRTKSAPSPEAPVLEVFASIQGEGLYLGQPQVFVRLSGCPLRCAWCDTPGSWVLPGKRASARLDLAEGEHLAPSRATAQQIAAWVEAADPGGARPVSVTGGEPLLWTRSIRALRAALPGRRLHLETAGAFPESLAAVLDSVDHVSADLKAPQDLADPVPVEGQVEAAPRDSNTWRSARRAVLRLLAGRDACTKLVVAGDRTTSELRPLLEDHAELAPDLPLFLQPVTPMRGVAAASPAALCAVSEVALSLGLVTRVVPQVHRLLGLP